MLPGGGSGASRTDGQSIKTVGLIDCKSHPSIKIIDCCIAMQLPQIEIINFKLVHIDEIKRPQNQYFGM